MVENKLEESPATAPGSEPATLLLVDDEENILSSLKRLLRRDGYRILSATSGAEGLQLLASHDVDVIVSDQRMPQMTGVEFLRKAREICPDTVRIVLSGYTELQSIIDAVNEGAVYKFLTKPWDDDQLRGHIRQATRQKRLADENLELTTELAAANAALAESNRDLEVLLAQNSEKLATDETVIEIAHEILESLPLPLIGLDDQNMIVFANRRAQELFVGHPCGIGSFAELCFPEVLQRVLNEVPVGSVPWRGGNASYRVSCHRMGLSSSSQGKMLIMIPESHLEQSGKEDDGSVCLG